MKAQQNFKSLPFIFLASMLLTFASFNFAPAQDGAQNEAPSLDDQFQELKENSESYEDYKVIKTHKLNGFWNTVEDSLAGFRKNLSQANNSIATLKSDLEQIKSNLDETQAMYEEVKAQKDSFNLFGLHIQKTLYNTILWGLILGALVLAGFAFVAFKESNRVTRQTKKDHEDLHKEFEDYRRKAQEKKVKIMRELQTERNKLEEYKNKVKQKEHSN